MLVRRRLSQMIDHNVTWRAKHQTIIHMKCTVGINSCLIFCSYIYRKVRSFFCCEETLNILTANLSMFSENNEKWLHLETIELFSCWYLHWKYWRIKWQLQRLYRLPLVHLQKRIILFCKFLCQWAITHRMPVCSIKKQAFRLLSSGESPWNIV